MSPIATSAASARSGGRSLFTLGAPALDGALGGGLERAALHEILAEPAHRTAASGFCVALAVRALHGGRDGGGPTGNHLVWLRQSAAVAETGAIHGVGLAGLGLDPRHITFVELRTPMELLRAAIETARCAAVGCAILELADTGQAADLKATRRLVLAAGQSGVMLLVMRDACGNGVGGTAPSAAWTRWRVRPVLSYPVLSPIPDQDHGDGPRFDITLLRHRAGLPEKRWQVEWNHDRHTFEQSARQLGEQSGLGEEPVFGEQDAIGRPTLSRAVVPVPAGRALAA